MALFTSDILQTLKSMREVSDIGGFEFMEAPKGNYYSNLRSRLDVNPASSPLVVNLSDEQYMKIEELGILADRDDQGLLLQIFTKPIGDRPTLFLEIIQRIGCSANGFQKPGCGGFGKGNFKDLFKSIEEYEKTLAID